MLFHDSNAVFRPLPWRGMATGSGLRHLAQAAPTTWAAAWARPPGHGRLGMGATGDAFARRLG